MRVKAIRTPIIRVGDDLLRILDEAIQELRENSVLAVTSKIVALCEGNVATKTETTHDELVEREADMILVGPKSYGKVLTLKNGLLIPDAGVDESNIETDFVLWPKNPQKTTNMIRKYLRKKFDLKNLGVIITDSRVLPLSWGEVGNSLAYSGFKALNDYVGTADLFGRQFEIQKTNVAVGLAASAVLIMGEGTEQTPLAIIDELENVVFCYNDPTEEELANLRISIEDDLFGPILRTAKWRPGKK